MSNRITIRVTPALHCQVAAVAGHANTNISDACRLLIERGLTAGAIAARAFECFSTYLGSLHIAEPNCGTAKCSHRWNESICSAMRLRQ